MNSKKNSQSVSVKARKLTPQEAAISKELKYFPELRKQFYFRVLNGDDLDTVIKPWLKTAQQEYDKDVDTLEETLEYLTFCEPQKQPELSDLAKALQVCILADEEVVVRQIGLLLPLYYSKLGYESAEFKKISYHFLDEVAAKKRLFTGQMLDFIFFGDYFSLASAVVLAKHSDLFLQNGMSSVVRVRLENMLRILAEKEKISGRVSDDFAKRLFELSLKRSLFKEEVSIMALYSLMQIHSLDNCKPNATKHENEEDNVVTNHLKILELIQVEKAIRYCDKYGFADMEMWKKALTFVPGRKFWDDQVELISKWLIKIKLDNYSELKAVTYSFIQESFKHGFLSAKIIDFIFDGCTFSNASTVVLSMYSYSLKEHNLSGYIQEKLNDMLHELTAHEGWDEEVPVVDSLLELSLQHDLSVEELSILNVYTLLQAFTH